MPATVIGPDGKPRCWWGVEPETYLEYHDSEWGLPVTNDNRLFEKLSLEGFQAGLSWLTILRKRPAFRLAFAGFDPAAVAAFDHNDIARLLADPGIVRHEGKIRSAINNAARALELIAEYGTLLDYFRRYAQHRDPPASIPAATPSSARLAQDLKRRGWSFVGPTTAYAFMQATGLVNDHLLGCWARRPTEEARLATFAGR